MGERADVLVRMPVALKRKIERRTIAAKRSRGLAWSQNDEIVAILEDATKGRRGK
jgi:hypothetical protein